MDLSCDYLIDITGLTDVPKEVYSCARQDGACENKNCPAAKNFEKKSSDYQTTMAENPSGTIDYDSLTRGKLCPLKAAEPPALAFWNLDPAPDVSDLLRAGVIKCRADGEPPRVEYIGGQCDGPRCAWYDQTAERCAVLSMARNK
mgnify:FL=1